MDIGGFSQTVYAYVVPELAFPMILGNPWKAHNKVRTAPERKRFFHGRARKWLVEGRNHEVLEDSGTIQVLATQTLQEIEYDFVRVVTTVEDIEKALKTKEYPTLEELKNKLPPEIHDMIPLFS